MGEFVRRSLTGIGFVAVVVGAVLYSFLSFAVLLAVVLVGCLVEYFRLARFSFLSFLGAVVFIVLPLFTFMFFRMGEDIAEARPATDGWVTLMIFATIWANDVAAYLTGSRWGRHKMAPKISPRKSWEGFVGGIVGAVAVGGVMIWFFGLPCYYVVATPVIALAAVGGDLAESWLKRRAGGKDSGRVFPGHGGFLDRFDAVLGVGTVGFLSMVIFLLFR